MRNKRKVQEPIVGLIQESKEQDALVKVLDLLPIEKIIKKEDIVCITPNWLKSKSPNTATVVGPNTLKVLIQYIKRYNPKKIIVATGSGSIPTPKVMKEVGYDKIIEEEKVDFVDLNEGPFIELHLNHTLPNHTKINELLEKIDVLISFTQLKQHEEATMSAAIKNIALAWPPAKIHGYPKKQLGIHEDLHGFIKAMIEKIPIDLSIVSLDKTMIGTGPSDGKAVDVSGMIIAGTDPVAVDTIGARLLGFLPQAIHYLYELYKVGVGVAEPEKMILKGMNLGKAEKCFSQAVYGKEIALDQDGIKNIHGDQ